MYVHMSSRTVENSVAKYHMIGHTSSSVKAEKYSKCNNAGVRKRAFAFCSSPQLITESLTIMQTLEAVFPGDRRLLPARDSSEYEEAVR